MNSVEVFRALGDPVRLKIVKMVATAGELCVCHIVEELGMSQPAVSHHLTRLRYSGLLKARKEGQWVYYSLNLNVLEELGIDVLNDLVKAAKSALYKGACYQSDV
ncbi:MAG: metalloregulator ArsR/SmtB family transcription factor [Armatimonadota bacterium]